MKKRKESPENDPKTLDTISAKTPLSEKKAKRGKERSASLLSEKENRGRKRTIPRNWVTGRAYSMRIQLEQVWSKLGGPLLVAKTEEQLKAAFEEHAKPYVNEFVPGRISDIFLLIRDRKFPKRKEVQITFLADSLGGRPDLSLRRSRDICEQERAKERRKSKHQIIRNEFYIECTCGYKGPALDSACRKCGAEIPVSLFGRTGKVSQPPLG